MENITCGVQQGPILGPLIFLIYVNDINKASKILNPIFLADDTNLLFCINIHERFKANKLSLNIINQIYIFSQAL